MKPYNQHICKSRFLVLALLLLILGAQSFNIQSQYDVQDKNKNLKQEKRSLQSSWLGFDLSAFSGGSIGNNKFQLAESNQPIVASTAAPQNIPAPTNNIQKPPASSPSSSQQPAQYAKISNNQFSGITLYHQIPSKFLYNQIYTFKGTVNTPASKISIIMSSSLGDNNQITVTQNLNGKSQFELTVKMSIVGRFYMTIFTGQTGKVARTQYQIKQTLQNRVFNEKAPAPIDQLSIYQKQNKVYVKWNNLKGDLYPIVRLTFEQFSTRSKIDYYFSNFESQVEIPFKDFTQFQRSTVSLAAVQAKSSSSSSVSRISQFSNPKMIFFNAEQHAFSQIKNDSVSISSNLFTFDIGSSFSITGRTSAKLKNQVVVLDPSNNFKTYLINSLLGNLGQVPTNSNINLNIDLSQQGVYIIEINNKDGSAVFNRPVYVGNNIIPILPDSQDLKQRTLTAAQIASLQPKSLTTQRQLLLDLINAKRKSFGLNPVQLDEKLNTLAQQHTEDMVRRNYNSHYSLEGLSPTDRAQNNGIYQEVGENIGVNSNITDAHYRLCRSNIHLRNIVNQKWVRVGLGVKLNSNNSFVVTQEFSTRDLSKQPLSTNQFDNIKSQLVSFVIFSNRAIRSENIDLSNKISNWHLNNYASRSATLSSFIGTLGYSRFSGAVIRLTYNSQSVDVVKAQPALLPTANQYTQMGISVKFNAGFLEVYVGYVS